MIGNIAGKKIAMVIAFRDFRDEEYFIPKETLGRAGATVKTASTKLGEAVGSQGGQAQVDILLDDLKVSDFDAVLFIGGSGAQNYFEDNQANRIAREIVDSNKTLGGICIAPAILAKAGVLDGKMATVWNSALDKSAVKILQDNGAHFQPGPVVVDDNIITANGPEASEAFANKIIEALSK